MSRDVCIFFFSHSFCFFYADCGDLRASGSRGDAEAARNERHAESLSLGEKLDPRKSRFRMNETEPAEPHRHDSIVTVIILSASAARGSQP